MNWYKGMQGGQDPYLCPEDELWLADWAYDRYDQLNTVRTNEVLHQAYELHYSRIERAAILLNPYHPGLAEEIMNKIASLKTPTRAWVNSWAVRYGYKVVNCRDLALERLRAADPNIIQSWIFGASPLLQRDPRLIFNVDETFMNFNRDYKGIQCGKRPAVAPEDTATHMTGVIAFSASGAVVKPFIILPGLMNLPQDLASVTDQATFASSGKGWITNLLWRVWAAHFVNWVSTYRLSLPQEIRYQPILLISDGHSTRSDPITIDLFRREKIQLLILPSHVSHILQPFDVGIGSPLKMHFRDLLINTKKVL